MSRRRTYRPQPTTDKRTPDERLEALVREPNTDRSLRMLMRIRRDLDDAPNPTPWLVAARTLSERLLISENSLYYFAEIFTECVIFSPQAPDPELARLRDEMDDIEIAYGLAEGQMWPIDEAPVEWAALNDAWNARARAIVAAALRQGGQADIADAREKSIRDFDKRMKKGRVELFGEDEELDR